VASRTLLQIVGRGIKVDGCERITWGRHLQVERHA
jgi:hypothetical protein